MARPRRAWARCSQPTNIRRPPPRRQGQNSPTPRSVAPLSSKLLVLDKLPARRLGFLGFLRVAPRAARLMAHVAVRRVFLRLCHFANHLCGHRIADLLERAYRFLPGAVSNLGVFGPDDA